MTINDEGGGRKRKKEVQREVRGNGNGGIKEMCMPED